ncbi:hypothetical protein F441_04925 [Phytophthora nicotianae CJ01A1]|uniref:Uncharacterized protein n=4 Tax=Phytophthora nicotianae TaxID=4792 RepID=V9FJZ2_PHYNI|nr:hypothetical protein F443_04924 [Phytophthora nicotianae P1569]ETK91707.1 hypothetical protein L915_04792 [Phytophthora nicotianae]ETO80574.1 hypothetical protein F444_04967 [Phytophthora nicotianae P1976]ETP21613.1 hypothetical protein F441_04925 [Phytophthora nicotianae CJ01A1]ETL45120.1 hypothetical protein L916_04738 [Phytophthora nicotianae]
MGPQRVGPAQVAAGGHHSNGDALSQLPLHTDNHQPAVTAVSGDCLNSSILAIGLTATGNRFDGEDTAGPNTGQRSDSFSSPPLHVHGIACCAACSACHFPK